MASRRNGNGAGGSNGHRMFAGTRAIILAGGRGTRLAPYTSIFPKPLMPIGERSILEIVVGQLAEQGFTDITFSVGYLSHLIRAVFDNHADPGVTIHYVHEDDALGTAGPLTLVEGLEDTFLMMNGDILTTLEYADLVRYHRREKNVLTIAAHERRVKFDYGVLHLANGNGHRAPRVAAYEEKPEVASTVSMGIYAVEPAALAYIPNREYFDIPELVNALLDAGEKVGAYPYSGLWFDIGRKDDYELAASVWPEHSRSARRHDAEGVRH